MKLIKTFVTGLLSVLLLAGCGSNPSQDGGDVADSEQSGALTSGAGQSGDFASSSLSEGAGDLKTVFYFDYDRSTLTYETRQALDGHAKRLVGSTSVIRLEGHADDRGTREYNLALGERRAKSVSDYLVLQGVPRSQIENVSYGEERPVAFAQDEQSYSLNRRVEMK